jgi:putative DNA primase/helicase
VGIACSSINGPIILDIDGASGAAYVNDTLVLPETYVASTRNKSRQHWYFAPPLSAVTVKRTIRPLGKDIELDILGDGGYIVAPPSVHPETGRRYAWIQKRNLRPLPESIVELLNLRPKKSAAAPLPAVIGEGRRDELLTSLAGSMRRRGASEEAILAALLEENQTRCAPPLPERQLRKIAHSIAQKAPAGHGEHLTDLGNARRFIEQHVESLRSCTAQRPPWFLWEGTHWTPDETGEAERLAKSTVRSLYAEAAAAGDDDVRDSLLKHAVKSEASPRITALMTLAATEPEISVTMDRWDADPWLLNVENGTLDLRKGVLLPHQRSNLITKLVPIEYNAKAKAPRWMRFLHEVMAGDLELIEFLQRAVGYSVTGDTREQCLFFCYGQGANGKSTFFETLRGLLNDYAQQSDFTTFLTRRNDGPRTDLARMRGARFVTAVEAQGDRSFDEMVLKQLTGGDTVVARRLYEREFEFKPQHKLWLAANHKPIVKEQTEAFWRRIRIVPFIVTFTAKQRDQQLGKILAAEASGILNWIVEGCLKWQISGLTEPSAVRRATRSYREENDVLGEFLTSQCRLDPIAWASTTMLYRAFNEWWIGARGTKTPISVPWFSRLLGERVELEASKRGGIRGWKGIITRVELSS